MVQEWWRKLNANERLAAQGAIVVLIASLVGGNWISLVGAGAVLVIYWLKYAPNQSIAWPAPVPLITLGISAIVALLALVGLLGLLGLGGLGVLGVFGGMYIIFLIGVIAVAIGAALMVVGTWREYQAMPKATSPASPGEGTSPGAPPAPPPASPPPAPPSSSPPPPAT